MVSIGISVEWKLDSATKVDWGQKLTKRKQERFGMYIMCWRQGILGFLFVNTLSTELQPLGYVLDECNLHLSVGFGDFQLLSDRFYQFWRP